MITIGIASCDGNGIVIVAAIDLKPPHDRALLRFPANVNRAGRKYPQVLLRHSLSRHGIFVTNYGVCEHDADYQVGLTSSSLPQLEVENERLLGRVLDGNAPGKVTDREMRSWNEFGQVASAGTLWPLYWQAKGRYDAKPFRIGIDPPRLILFDFVVTPAAECELYVVRPGEVVCLTNSVLPSRRTTIPGGHDLKPWEKRYSVPGAIDGPFAVVPHGKARYLVTPAGHVARMVDTAGKAEAKLATVFDASRVLAVLHDADEERRYAFTATQFFEVAEPFVMKPHAVKKFDTSNGAAGLETAFHCARAARGLPPVPFPPPSK